ncbi:MAG: hypothetical protein Q9181_002989 [Wetmoreana brouardii]
MDRQIEGKKELLEQQYIKLLEQRVAQLQDLVTTNSAREKNSKGNLPGDDEEIDPREDKTVASTSKTLLTKENLDKVANDTAKVFFAIGHQPRVRQVVSKYDEKTGLTEEVPIERANIQDEGTKSDCILRNVMAMDNPRAISHNEIDLGPGPLLDMIKEVMEDDDFNQTWTGQYVNLSSPFMSLVHKWDILKEAEIEKEGDSPEQKEARADLKQVLEFVQRSKYLEPYFKNRHSQRSSGIVEFNYLWTIFPTGTEVITSQVLDEKQIMIVRDPPHLYHQEKSQYLVCWYYDHTGTDWIVAEIEFKIERYIGTKAIHTLPCYPLSHHKQQGESANLEDMKIEFTKRGEKFKRLCTAKPGVGQMFDYKGQLLSVESLSGNQHHVDGADEQSSYQSSLERKPESVTFKKAPADGKIQVDPKSFLEQAPLNGCDLWLGEEEVYFDQTREKRYEISEEKKFLIAPPRVLGWSTVRKSWCEFLVSQVEPARVANDATFEKELQLDANVKNMIRALITQHNSQLGEGGIQNPDLIEGKGRGLVIMLHGWLPPQMKRRPDVDTLKVLLVLGKQ